MLKPKIILWYGEVLIVRVPGGDDDFDAALPVLELAIITAMADDAIKEIDADAICVIATSENTLLAMWMGKW